MIITAVLGSDWAGERCKAHGSQHEIRHWAQIAVTVRRHELAPPCEHDLVFSESFGL